MQLSTRVDKLIGSMSLEQKAGQVFIFTLLNARQAENDLRLHPGGYIRIFSDALSTAKENKALQAKTELPLLMCADFERGIGSTVYGAIDLVGNMCIGASGDERLSFECAKAIAEEARAIGVNFNYVPVMDVNINEANPIINIRSFGADPELVARLGTAFIRGTQAGGTLACAKHFPGHGDTHTDTHSNLGTITASRQRLEAVELLPFRRAIEAGVDSVMSVHLHVPALEPEPLPSTMSRRIMHDLLRGELGFTGVSVTDALEMGAIARNFSPEDAITRAFNAGCDQLIMPLDNVRAVNTIIQGVRNGKISEARLDEAVARILTMKEKRGLFEEAPLELANLADKLHTPAHYQTALETALSGITLVKNQAEVLPLKTGQRVAVLSVSNQEDSRAAWLEPKTFADHCARYTELSGSVDCGSLSEHMISHFDVVNKSLEAATQADVILLGAYVKVVMNRGTVDLEPRYLEFVERLARTGKPIVLVSFGNPYLLKQFPMVSSYVCGYGASQAAQEACAMLLCGKAPFKGQLPVTISGIEQSNVAVS